MNGQMTLFKEKQILVEEFINKVDPYSPQPSLKFDLRGYAKYIQEYNLSADEISEEIMTMFKK